MFHQLTAAVAAALLCSCAGTATLRADRVAADTTSPAAQRAYVDPKTGKLTTRPIGPRSYAAPKSAAEAALPLGRTAEGYEFLDMSQYQMTTRAVRTSDGTLAFRCLHPHTDATHTQEHQAIPPTRQL